MNNCIAVDFEIEAITDNLNIYSKGYKNFRKLYESTKNLMKEMDD